MYVPANPYPLLLNSVCALGSKHLNTSARAPVNPPLSSRKMAEMEFPDFSHMSKQEIEDKLMALLPGFLHPVMGWCGGPVPTVEKCMCVMPSAAQPHFQQAIDHYKSL